ncbi:two-component system sensor kinase FixL [Sphingomonas vulcanisoli]|uniref:histidine kinase n=1 Tax=Sphingomonas vulcanisoli TaxID=1658060 RepID=A0ABX0TPA1_9SPHN|nr:PAS domain S-box protein [Sphingomonas vulcanisoli]NIJ07363.1 two-component system sensor kinase FixL [Sphingomonas vulcanisoli]
MRELRSVGGFGLLLLALGLLVPAASLIGRVIDAPLLYRLGTPWSIWPMAAAANLALGIGQALILAGQRRAGSWTLALPIMIGLLTLLEYALGRSIGIDTLLFGSSLEQLGLPTVGRITFLSTLALIATAAATLIAVHGDRRREILVFLLCAIVMGFGWLSAGLLMAGFGPEVAGQSIRLTCSPPGAITMVCLACLPLVYRSKTDPAGLFGPGKPSFDAIIIGLPILMILPAGLVPLEHALAVDGLATTFTAYVLALTAELAVGLCLIGIGVTRIARSHAALEESDARLDHALEAHRIGLFDWQLAGDQLRWSPGAEERIAIAPGTITDLKSWMDLIVPEDAEKVMAAIADAAENRRDRYTFTYRMNCKDGEQRTFEGSARTFFDSSGALVRVTGVNIDVTERVRREADIARREAQWLSMLRTVPDAMVIFDREGIVRSFSSAAERLFGFSAEEIVGRSALTLLPETDAQVAAAQIALGIAPGGMRTSAADQVFTAQRKDGSQFPAEYSFGEVMVDGRPWFTVFVRDISARQQADRQFAALQQDYAHSARLNAVGELASGLAHELNQPLAAGANFLGTAELLLEDVEGAEAVGEMIASANAQMIRAGEIIRRLRDFIAKTDADMRVEPLEDVLREAVALALVGARQQQIEVDYRLDPRAQMILADRIQIQQVVVNLVRNAAQALRLVPRERRRIVIAARPIDEEMLEVRIIDQGRGLSPEILERLFAPFRSTKSGEGLGIGLSICRRIIEAHGGTLSAANLPEGGAQMSFTLPRIVEDQGAGDVCVTSMS